MNTKTFIDRPLLSIVISVGIVILGIISMLTLPIERYPEIAPPVIYVWASYPGANAETVNKVVIMPLEEAINGVEGMTYMQSSASNGSASVTIYFEQGTNADMAAVNVQNRVIQAQSQLPAEVLKIGVSTEKRQPGQLRIIALESPNNTYDESFLSNYFYNNLRPALLRIKDVGKVEVWGSQYALCIWLKPDVMARYKLMPSDVANVLAEQNIEVPVGTIGENSSNVFQYPLRYTGRKTEIAEFENIVITSLPNGEELLLKDIADVELGQSEYNYINSINGHHGVMGSVSQVAGSNATRINLEIDRLLEEVARTLPEDIEIVTFDNTNDFLFASIREVIITLIIAVFLVLFVVLFFLQDFRATLVPALGILVSLIGTFAFMYVAGFSINLLTLFALVLVIGTVVDDSIIVVEAVKAQLDDGCTSAYDASVKAMRGLATTLFTTTLVFMTIFIPLAFVGGTTSIFFRQFGLTMAVAVGISLVNALTLSPAICALILRPQEQSGRLTTWIQRVYKITYTTLLQYYSHLIARLLPHKKWVIGIVVLSFFAFGFLFRIVPTGFIPNEDMGTLFVDMVTPTGYTAERTFDIMNATCDKINALPEVQDIGAIVGIGGGSNSANILVQLKPWSERKGKEHSIDAVKERINTIIEQETEIQGFVSESGMLDGYGNSGGFEFMMQARGGQNIVELNEITRNFIDTLETFPAIGSAYSSYEINNPQYRVDIDVSRCKKLAVSPATVLRELGVYLGGEYASDFNKYNHVYRVTQRLRPSDSNTIEAIENLFVRSEKGEMLPISQFITLTKEYVPFTLNNFNMFPCINVMGEVAEGYSSGNAIQAIQEAAAKCLPKGYNVEFSGITREEIHSSSQIGIILVICILFIYLVMVALYESLFVPLAVMLSISFGMVGCLLFAKLFGVENNIYMQIGMIMLVGLLCKTAILLTEYASQARRNGLSLYAAALEGAKERLRPILMTSVTMIIGMLPMMFATGVGANGSRTIGACVVGGMLLGTIGLLIVVPTLFVIFQHLQEKYSIRRR